MPSVIFRQNFQKNEPGQSPCPGMHFAGTLARVKKGQHAYALNATMPFKAAPGFNTRLLAALNAVGLESAEDLANGIHISLPTANVLLRSSTPVVDAVTLIRVCDLTDYSGQWLMSGTGPPSRPVWADPDEKRLLQLVREIPDERRDAVLDRILDVIHEVS